MIDLTKIEKPFGLLAQEEQKALQAWPHGWEMYSSRGWHSNAFPAWVVDHVYRAKTAPREPAVVWANEYSDYAGKPYYEAFITQDDANKRARPDFIRFAVKFVEVMENE